jgi:hypothetical protein
MSEKDLHDIEPHEERKTNVIPSQYILLSLIDISQDFFHGYTHFLLICTVLVSSYHPALYHSINC